MPITEKQRERNRRRHEEALPAYHALMSCYPLSLDDLPGEQWRDIDEHYQISTFGRVKSFWGKSPRILKPYLLGEYLSVNLYVDGKRKTRTIHSLVAKAFIPNPENKPEVNHRVGCKFNCHVSNLQWSTGAENMQHAVRTGLAKSGVDRSDSKIKNEAGIIYIRENPDKLTRQQLAEKFGVDETTISYIQLGKRYPNVGGTIRESKVKRVPEEIRAQICADWATGQYSKSALARKFGYSQPTIRNIINESA